jgi:cellulose synthase/poly-beta-1,6-N-acetylglucosamine synthase-like glycosyltransferase
VQVDWDKELADWPLLEWPAEPIRPAAPSRQAVWQVRILALGGVVALAIFFSWLVKPEHRGDPWLFWPLVAALGYRALSWLIEWMNYARPKFEPYTPPKKEWRVDILTTACPGEPRGMILRTLRAMKNITYPHRDVLCDEGDDPVLKEACRQLGVLHVTRQEKKHAKAGNINNALQQCTGEIVVVLDPDHEPAPYLLDRVLGYFEDPEIGFVQSVQAYRNQKDSLVADGAAKQTYLFYGPLMIGMNAYGTTQAIGANCVFRRAALDSIGGHASGLAEDMHTTIQLYSKGWKSHYVPEIWTRGLVPSNLPAYCKQQLKWAYGSFDLLLRIMPKVFGGMTTWQRLHYSLGPLYFLRGLVGAFNILVPILCLIFGGIGLRIELLEYLAMFAPAMIISAVVRQLTQRWVIEERERGAHMIGGILATGCWWVFAQGVLCAIFNIKLPYLPTPKDNEANDCWAMVMPNLVAGGLSLAVIPYGLWIDWTPFSLFMAFFALWNAGQLLFVAALGQQRTLQRLAYFFAQRDYVGRAYEWAARMRLHVHAFVLSTMREKSMAVALPVIALALAAHFWPKAPLPKEVPDVFKETGGFYIGIKTPPSDEESPVAAFDRAAHRLSVEPRLFPIAQTWDPAATGDFPAQLAHEARAHGATPLITWELPEEATIGGRVEQKDGLYTAITRGALDGYIRQYAEAVRDYRDPVMIRFAPKPDADPAAPSRSRLTPGDYVGAWIYVVSYFNNLGASNVGWVWSPSRPEEMQEWFPGHGYVDWIALSTVNHGAHGGGKWQEFAELYAPWRAEAQALKLPVLLADFGSVGVGGDRRAWLSNAFRTIAENLPEVRGVIVSTATKGWLASEPRDLPALKEGLALAPLRSRPAKAMADPLPAQPPYHSRFIAGTPGEYQLLVDGQPFYIRGVAYNPGHDWRDGNIPLTRRELETDLDRVTALGANTIRRYGRGFYDRNVLRMADQKHVKVLYGFWFEHQIDYLNDADKLASYEHGVESTIESAREHESVLAWAFGNEVWGLLKHHYAQPYLTEIRHAHVAFVERLAQKAHQIDPRHPVFAAHEHSPHIAGTLVDYAREAPSLDFTAVNSYYEPRIADLRRVATTFDPGRPYLISEFGPDGYWDERFSERDASGSLLEPLSADKAEGYERGWLTHTLPNRGANIGGVAYCWRDRLEATATWFGLTDAEGRPKPAFLALQHAWKGSAETQAPRLGDFVITSGTPAPGATIEVQARAQHPNGAPLKYEWKLASDDFDFEVGRVEASRDGTSAKITLPKKPGGYRLYVNVNDGRSADEANLPIAVQTTPPAAIAKGIEIPRSVPTVAKQQ